jgi:hypothetical protein
MSEEESQEPRRVERKLLIRIIPAEIVHPTSFRSNPLSRYDLKCPLMARAPHDDGASYGPAGPRLLRGVVASSRAREGPRGGRAA